MASDKSMDIADKSKSDLLNGSWQEGLGVYPFQNVYVVRLRCDFCASAHYGFSQHQRVLWQVWRGFCSQKVILEPGYPLILGQKLFEETQISTTAAIIDHRRHLQLVLRSYAWTYCGDP